MGQQIKRLELVSSIAFQVKFVVFEVLVLASFLYVVYQLVSREIKL